MTRDMQDNLEKFIKNNSDKFDNLSPSDSVWKGIEQELQAGKGKSNQLFVWKTAAMILLVFSIGLTLFVNRDLLISSESLVVYDDEFRHTENFYTAEIYERQQLIRSVGESYPDIEIDFELDWKMLDIDYDNLKEEYKSNQNENIRSAMVQNLRARVDLLNRQLQVLEQIKNKESNIIESTPKTDDFYKKTYFG